MIQKDICKGRRAWGDRRERSQQQLPPQGAALTCGYVYPARDAPEQANRVVGTWGLARRRRQPPKLYRRDKYVMVLSGPRNQAVRPAVATAGAKLEKRLSYRRALIAGL